MACVNLVVIRESLFSFGNSYSFLYVTLDFKSRIKYYVQRLFGFSRNEIFHFDSENSRKKL